MSITLKPVKSSHLAKVGYDEKNKILRIQFNDGSEYEYYKVLKQEHHRLMNATSIGGYFKDKIEGKYEYRKVKDKTR